MVQWIMSSSALILAIIALRFLLRGKIRLKLQYALWGLVLARLLLPIQFGNTAISLQNAVEEIPAVQQIVLAEEVDYFQFHDDGTVTGYLEIAPDISYAEKLPQTFTAEEAVQLTAIRTTGEWLRIIWICGMAVMGMVFLVANLRFAHRLKQTRQLLETQRLPVYKMDIVDTPFLFGLVRPAVYLTSEVAEKPQHRQYAVAHEITHYCHGDMVWSALRCVALILHWYNPLVWWAAVLSRADGELACDEATILRIGEENRADYGRVLIDLTCRKRSDVLHTATMMTDSAKRIRERIARIAKKPRMAVYTLIVVFLVAAIAVGCTFTGGRPGADEPEMDVQPTKTPETSDPTPEATEDSGPFLTPTGPPAAEPGKNAWELSPSELAVYAQAFSKTPGQRNWYHQAVLAALTGGSYNNAGKVPVKAFLSCGGYDESWLATAQQTTLYMHLAGEGEVVVISAPELEQIYKETFGITFSESQKRFSEKLMNYDEKEDAYFFRCAETPDITLKLLSGKQDEGGGVYLQFEAVSPQRIWQVQVVLVPRTPETFTVYACKIISFQDIESGESGNGEKILDLPGTALDAKALAELEALFTNPYGNDTYNWYNLLLFCAEAKGFEKPEDVPLDILFNNGYTAGGGTFTKEEEEWLKAKDALSYESRVTAKEIDKVLSDYMGLTLAQTNKVGMEWFLYYSGTDSYFMDPRGAAGAIDVEVLQASRQEDGACHIVFASPWSTKYTYVRLMPTRSKDIPYHVVAGYPISPRQ